VRHRAAGTRGHRSAMTLLMIRRAHPELRPFSFCNPASTSHHSLSMSELPKTYEPAAVEQKWYARWLEAEDFRADVHSSKPPFSIVIPPPNVTGVLTLGHVLNNTIQDVLARRAWMNGFEVLWLPGTDHA